MPLVGVNAGVFPETPPTSPLRRMTNSSFEAERLIFGGEYLIMSKKICR
jgi:hypothetical protein